MYVWVPQAEGRSQFTTQFTCFTSTKVQILTSILLICVCVYRRPRGAVDF